MTNKRGLLIVLEGCDRTGKSTQAARLVAHLTARGCPAVPARFPDRTTTIGGLINTYLTDAKSRLDDRAVHLLFSANRWEAMSTIRAHIEQGTTVVVDRYAFSGVAFTAAKGIDIDWCRAPDRGLLAPDVVLFLDLPVAEAEKRGEYGAERYETRAFQELVRDNYHRLRDETWVTVDAGGSVESVARELCAVVDREVGRAARPPIESTLWVERA